MNFPFVKLGEIADIRGGKRVPLGHAFVEVETPHPYIRARDIRNGSIELTEPVFLSEETFGFVKNYTVKTGDVCLTIVGVIGAVGTVPEKLDGASLTENAVKFVNLKNADPKYIKYCLLSEPLQLAMQNAASGVAQPKLGIYKIKELKLPFPPLQVQNSIASILSAYDDLIENNNRRIALLEESMRLLYREWFVRLRFPGHEHVRVVDGLPEGWEMKPLEEICDLTMGQSPPSDTYNINGDGLPFHQGVTRFGDRFISHEMYCTSPNRVAEPGDILFSVRAPVGRINITLDKIIIGRGLSAIRSKTGNQSFLYYQLKEHFFKEDLLGSGAIFASVTKKELSNELLLNPKCEIIAAFEEISKPIDQQITNLYMQNIRLSEARDLLLPRLMSGEIDVS